MNQSDKKQQEAAKEYLRQARDGDLEIQFLEEDLEVRRERLYGRSYNFQSQNNSGKGSSGGGYIEIGVQSLIDCEEKYARKIRSINERRAEIEETVSLIEDSRERQILTRRYLHHQEWQEIAKKMNHAVSHIYKLHAQALLSPVIASRLKPKKGDS
jgi:DNA-directed RNA polymerase specialized sigma subunit